LATAQFAINLRKSQTPKEFTALINRFLVFTLAATCALTTSVGASDERALASVAAADGFTYAWLPTESGVVLTRPGVRVVLRPGRLFYEVNNATPIADRAPTFNGEDLLISPLLVERLAQIAHASSAAVAATEATMPKTIVVRAAGAPRPITIAAKLVPGRTSLELTGNGTPNTTIAITLTEEISKDLPVVTIRRAAVAIDTNGSYSIQMGYGPDVHDKTTVTATAASATGADRAVAHIVVEAAPTGVTSTGLDDWPKN
jgi:hypothetical protein